MEGHNGCLSLRNTIGSQALERTVPERPRLVHERILTSYDRGPHRQAQV